MIFPLHFRPKESYHERPRAFGSPRDHGTRKHAGCDLYAPANTMIIAVDDGIVLSAGPFYDGTWSVVVDHDLFIVRYGEVQPRLPAGIAPGQKVRQGQQVGWVGRMKHITQSMLHFEMFSGTEDGALTDRSNRPYMRRGDLLDPTEHLDAALLFAGDFSMSNHANFA